MALPERDSVFSVISGTSSVESEFPVKFSVPQNSSNPFNPETTITFAIPKPDMVKVEIFSLSGQRIDCLVDSYLKAGNHSVKWNAAGCSAGIYLCRVTSGENTKVIKMLFIK